MSPAKTGAKQEGRFQPDQSGNPPGRPRGSRNGATIALEALGGEGEAITRTADGRLVPNATEQAGATYREIGGEVGLHGGTVQRILDRG